MILPKNTYFIHGLPHWSKDYFINFIEEEISISLQKDGHTIPLRPIGFILDIKSFNKAFDRDVASKVISGRKELSIYSKNIREYKENELEELIKYTRIGSHNEIWVDSSNAEITGAYVYGRNKTFEKYMKNNGYNVHLIPEML